MKKQKTPPAGRAIEEVHRPPAGTNSKIEEMLNHFQVLPTPVERRLVWAAYLYLPAAAVPFLVLFTSGVLLVPALSTYLSGVSPLLVVAATTLAILGYTLTVRLFQTWQQHIPDMLRQFYQQEDIQARSAERSERYLAFLQRFRAALCSPKRYLMIGGAVLPAGAFLLLFHPLGFLDFVSFLAHHPTGGDTVLLSLLWLFYLLPVGVSSYCLGLVLWAQGICLWYLSVLRQAFEVQT